jgi:NAD(P)H-dependent flavin oxidoreductase YrpB (nitropropane dioxygenase family)
MEIPGQLSAEIDRQAERGLTEALELHGLSRAASSEEASAPGDRHHPNRDLLGVDLPITQAPMPGPTTVDLVVAVCEAGGLGLLPFAAVSPSANQGAARHCALAHRETDQPIIFCHLTSCDAHTYFPEWFNGWTEHDTAAERCIQRRATWSTSLGCLPGPLAKRIKDTRNV